MWAWSHSSAGFFLFAQICLTLHEKHFHHRNSLSEIRWSAPPQAVQPPLVAESAVHTRDSHHLPAASLGVSAQGARCSVIYRACRSALPTPVGSGSKARARGQRWGCFHNPWRLEGQGRCCRPVVVSTATSCQGSFLFHLLEEGRALWELPLECRPGGTLPLQDPIRKETVGSLRLHGVLSTHAHAWHGGREMRQPRFYALLIGYQLYKRVKFLSTWWQALFRPVVPKTVLFR